MRGPWLQDGGRRGGGGRATGQERHPVLLGGALLLREIVRLVDFGVRHLQFNLVSRPYVHRRTTRQHGPWLAAGETFSTPQHYTGSFLGRFLGVLETAAGAAAAAAAAAAARERATG